MPQLGETVQQATVHAVAVDEGVPLESRAVEIGASSGGLPQASPAGGDFVDVPLRRGLPREAGAEPWPAAGSVPVAAHRLPLSAVAISDEPHAPELEAPSALVPEPSAASALRPTVARRYGRYTLLQWMGAGLVSVLALALAVTLIVLAAQWIAALEPVRDFTRRYPGTYPLPPAAEAGFPAWASWQHFFNLFLIALLIRAGLGVRLQGRQRVYWTSRRDSKPAKISLMQWFHQVAGVLWIANGVIFVVLLLVTTHWMRIVPTSWEVFPNAASALLQYLTLDWPLENGWVNYNSLQQLAYFVTVFIAAPLSVVTGYRLSTAWPQGALGNVVPIKAARALHFPTMLYFVVFIIGHVTLVLSTGAVRNLNAMFASRHDAQSPIGFIMLFVALAVTAAAVVAVRPTLLAPLARLFGTVSSR